MTRQRDTSGRRAPHEHQAPLTGVMHRNIRALVVERRRLDATQPRQYRIADAITRFTGSMRFVYLHVVLFGGWIVVNREGPDGGHHS